MWGRKLEKRFIFMLLMVKIVSLRQQRKQNVNVRELIEESLQLHQVVIVLQRPRPHKEIKKVAVAVGFF
jgi:hypothetical protein